MAAVGASFLALPAVASRRKARRKSGYEGSAYRCTAAPDVRLPFIRAAVASEGGGPDEGGDGSAVEPAEFLGRRLKAWRRLAFW